MTTPKWQAGHLYLTGDLVQPQQVPAPTRSSLTNPGFETGATTGWTITQSGGTGTASVATDKVFSGTNAGRWQGAAGSGHSGGVEALWENDTDAAVTPGQSITGKIMFALDDTDSSQNQAQARLHWYDDGGTLISSASGNLIHGDSRSWQQSAVTGSAPAGAATVRLAGWTTANAHGGVRIDAATWNHVNPAGTAGLIYKAVQDGPGTSASSEPTWPTTLGVQVTDNTVTWEAVNTNRVVWEASPILTSGTSEPDWPTSPGDFVSDGTVKWECLSRRIEDENCPNTKVVCILSSKVFAVDKDIVRFSATANPLDWTSERDAGFLPTGLQQANSNDMAVLAPYRNNLAALNPSCFQLWQTDPDPEAMAQLDQMEGIGSSWPRAAQAVGNDLLFLTKLGVRSIAIAAGADNLSAGDVGMPVDPLIQAAMADANSAIATYYPGAGQYWLAFRSVATPSSPLLSGDLPDGTVGDAVSYEYTVTGGRAPYTFSIVSGSVPDGTTMNSDGVVYGTYATAGSYGWTVRVTDAGGATDDLADTASVGVHEALYLAGGAGGNLYTATDVSAWTSRATGTTQGILGIASGASAYVIVGGTGGGTVLKSSSNLTTWTDRTPNITVNTLCGIARGAGLFVAVGNTGGTDDGKITTSPDGLAWTARSAPAGCGPLTAITFNNGLFVAVSSTGQAIVSSDGVTWAKHVAGTNLQAIAYDGALFMAVGSGGETTTSPDGETWTARSAAGGASYSFLGVAGHDGTWVAAANGTFTFAGAYTSTDNGVTWARTGGDNVSTCAAFVGGLYLVGDGNGEVLSSTDGETWETNLVGGSFAIQAIYGALV